MRLPASSALGILAAAIIAAPAQTAVPVRGSSAATAPAQLAAVGRAWEDVSTWEDRSNRNTGDGYRSWIELPVEHLRNALARWPFSGCVDRPGFCLSPPSVEILQRNTKARFGRDIGLNRAS